MRLPMERAMECDTMLSRINASAPRRLQTYTGYTLLSIPHRCRFARVLRGESLVQGKAHHALLRTGCPCNKSIEGKRLLQGWSLTGLYTIQHTLPQRFPFLADLHDHSDV